MADTGLVLCGTGANIAGSGTDWTNPSNVTTEVNYAEADLPKNNGLSNYLRATDLGFSVPTGAAIDGVEVQISHQAEHDTSTPEFVDEFVYLVNGGSIISGCTNKASSTPWDNIQETYTYGGSIDTWNCTLNPATVNSSTFGAQIMVKNGEQVAGQWGRVYWVKVKVHYTTGSGQTAEAEEVFGVSESVTVRIGLPHAENMTGDDNLSGLGAGVRASESAVFDEEVAASKSQNSVEVVETSQKSETVVVRVSAAFVESAAETDEIELGEFDDARGDESGLLLSIFRGGVTYRYSLRDIALNTQWHGVITGLDPVKMALPTRHGGFLRVSAGRVTFAPSAFGGIDAWSIPDWPPPKSLGATFKCKAAKESSAVKLFEGVLYRVSISEKEIVYDVYISSFTNTIAAGTSLGSWPATNTLVGFFEKVCEVLGLTLDSSKATGSPPSLSHVLSNERLVVDVASEVAAFCSHLFWINDGALYLQQMSASNGTLSLRNPNDYFRSPAYSDDIPVNRVVAGAYEHVGSEYPYGVDYSLPANYTGDSSQLQGIYDLLNAHWAEVAMPLHLSGFLGQQ